MDMRDDRAAMMNNLQKPPMHSGRWAPEEEEYVQGLIAEFNAGLLPIAEGTTLRSFLAKMLNCNPKRVSKKYDGNKIYNGKLAYKRSKTPLSRADACARQEDLLELERRFREGLLTMQRVESRLQSLTGSRMPPPADQQDAQDQQQNVSWSSANGSSGQQAATAAGRSSMPHSSSWTCSSAVSSLTADDEEQDGVTEDGEVRVEETSIAQISQQLSTGADSTDVVVASSSNNNSSSSGDQKPVARSVKVASSDEAAASEILLRLNGTPPRHGASASDQDCAATDSSNESNDLHLRSLLQKINDLRYAENQEKQQQNMVTPLLPSGTASNLQNFLSHPPGSALQQQQRRFGSPIQKPEQTRNGLQDLLHSLQEKTQPEKAQPVASDVERLLLGALIQAKQSEQQQQPAPQESTADVLGKLLQQVASANGAAPAPQPSAETLFLQSLAGADAGPKVSHEETSASIQNLMGFIERQRSVRLRKQKSLDDTMTALVQQLQQNMVEQQMEYEREGSNLILLDDPNVQGLMESLKTYYSAPSAQQQVPQQRLQQQQAPTQQQQAQQAFKPHTVNNVSSFPDQETLQQLLVQLQQSQSMSC